MPGINDPGFELARAARAAGAKVTVLPGASAVLLARLDLTRLRVVPPPLLGCVAISGWVLLGIAIGRSLHNRLGSYLS